MKYTDEIELDLSGVTAFDWDAGNIRKNEKHGVTSSEVERIFSNRPLLVALDLLHSQGEDRFAAFGRTDEGRLLAVAFTFREGRSKIRAISARPMNRRERNTYEKASKENS